MWTIESADVSSPDALKLLREYFVDVADRYYLLHLGRRGTTDEIETGLAGAPSDDLAPPAGVFLLGTYDGKAAGCAGLRIKDAETVELGRVFVRPAFRGTGGGPALLTAVEDVARALGATQIILDTRLDLTEARALYTKNGYEEVSPYKQDKYAEIFYAKQLT